MTEQLLIEHSTEADVDEPQKEGAEKGEASNSQGTEPEKGPSSTPVEESEAQRIIVENAAQRVYELDVMLRNTSQNDILVERQEAYRTYVKSRGSRHVKEKDKLLRRIARGG